MPESPDSACDWIAFISISTSVEKSTSSAVLPCALPASRLLLDVEEAAPDPGMCFAKVSLLAWLVSFFAGQLSVIPSKRKGSEESCICCA